MSSTRSLESFFKDNPRVAIACSGGTDSTFLVHVAREMGADVLPIVVKSQLTCHGEAEEAVEFCRSEGLEAVVLDMDMLSDDRLRANGPDRCYHCKRALFTAISDYARTHGYQVIADGTNASDEEEERPGMRALRELDVRSPLREAGLTKSQIRRLARSNRLSTWNRSSNSCLATRVATGVPLSEELLERIGNSEDALAEMGFHGFRVTSDGTGAVVVFTASQRARALSCENDISEALSPWFDDVRVSEMVRNERGRAQEPPAGCGRRRTDAGRGPDET